MKVKKVLEKLDEFEALLQEFHRARRDLVGNVPEEAVSSLPPSTPGRAHFAFDDFRLGLLRQYHTLRPYIKSYSKLFSLIPADDKDPVDIYEFFIEQGVGNIHSIFEDLAVIRKCLNEMDEEKNLEENGIQNG
jgi:hypothetical protein